MYYTDSGKQCSFHVSCFRITDESVEEATYRVFKISDISVLDDLKFLVRRFGLEWNFVSTRSGKTISYRITDTKIRSTKLYTNNKSIYN